jgi:hypothetical protein
MTNRGEEMQNHSTRRGVLGAGAVLVGLVVVLTGLAALAGSDTAAGQAASAPVNTSRPSISGRAQENNALSANPGKWSGSQPISFSGVWLRCDRSGDDCFNILGTADRLQYALQFDDVGHRIRVRVTASNKDGTATATSSATSVISAAPPTAPRNTSAPTIAGTAQEGQSLAGDRGQWEGTPPIDYSLYWQRCDRNGGSCANISGAQSTNYTLTSADVDNRVRFRVTARNRAGSTTAFSNPSGVVAAKGPDLPPGAIRLPDGKYSIPVTSVAPPERLVIGQLDFQPNPLRSRESPVTARFRISDTRGYIVRGALVFVTPLPYGWVTQPSEVLSEMDGWATVMMRANPQLPRRAAIVMFVRARKPGDFVLTGVSNRRLVQMLVAIA